MHRALQVDEIVRVIFAQLEPSLCWRDRQTLSRAAQTCTSFREPALDVLWRECNAVEGVLQLLPSFMTGPRFPRKGNYYHLFRPPSEQEWARFRYYAKRVRSIHAIGGDVDCNSRESVLSQLMHLNGDNPLLPALKHLWYNSHNSYDHGIRFLLSPSVEHLWISLNAQNVGVQALISGIADRLPHLKSFRAVTPFQPTPLLLISTHQSLRRLELIPTSWSNELFTRLAALPELLDLKLNVPALIAGDVSPSGYECLEILTLKGQRRHLQTFISSVNSARLHTLRLTVDIPSHRVLESACARIASDAASRFPDLRDFFLEFVRTEKNRCSNAPAGHVTPGAEVPQPSADELLAALAPLQSLHFLQCVSFRVFVPLNPSPDALFVSCEGWPALESLCIEGEDEGKKETCHFDHRVLIDFVARFPHLRELELPFIDFSRTGPLPVYVPTPSSLRVLRLSMASRHSIYRKDEEVARLLRRHFPELDAEAMLRSEVQAEQAASSPYLQIAGAAIWGTPGWSEYSPWLKALKTLVELRNSSEASPALPENEIDFCVT